MFTFVTAAATGLLWLLVAAFVIMGTLSTYIVLAVIHDIRKTYKIKKERRGNCSF